MSRDVWGFDLETTGRDPLSARIVSAALVHVDAGGEVTTERLWLSDPGIPIPEEAAAVHGISTEYAQEHGEDRVEVLSQLLEALACLRADGATIAGHNIVYDLTVVAGEATRTGLIEAPEELVAVLPSVLDTLVLDRWVDKYRRGRRTLTAVAEHYGVLLLGAHEASADATASARIAQTILAGSERLSTLDSTGLLSSQRRWAREQAVSLQAYLRQRNPDAYVCPEWPVQSRNLTRAELRSSPTAFGSP